MKDFRSPYLLTINVKCLAADLVPIIELPGVA